MLEGRVRLPSGTAEVTGGGDDRTVVAQPGECRQRGSDPEVVGHDAAATRGLGDRDVEVEPDENALSLQIPQVFEKRHISCHRAPITPSR